MQDFRLLASSGALVALISLLGAMPQPAARLPAAPATSDARAGSWSRDADKDGWRVAIQFTNYNGNRLAAAFPVSRLDMDQAMAEFGFRKAETDEILKSCRTCNQAEYDRRMADYYRQRGLAAVLTDRVMRLSVDMPELVRRNAPRVRAAAMEIDRIAKERQYDSGATIGAALSMVQTGIPYFAPPMQEDGKEILGVYVPPQVLGNGKGDCDSKTGLIASLLKNFSGARTIGINVPNHYLMGIARVPQRGEAFLEYDGEPYVLLEAAGPAWLPPGSISDHSRAMLGTMRDVRVDPFR
ncbi:MAG TPA: hypothetical protein VFV78_06535 [Vicinamibacterales bacterium]|nr:hypothetical protein [Vicinamibacterales bacterium]